MCRRAPVSTGSHCGYLKLDTGVAFLKKGEHQVCVVSIQVARDNRNHGYRGTPVLPFFENSKCAGSSSRKSALLC